MFSQQCLYLSSWLALMFTVICAWMGYPLEFCTVFLLGKKERLLDGLIKGWPIAYRDPSSFISSSISEDKVQVREEGEVNGMWRTGDDWTGTDGCYSAQSDNMGNVSWVNKNR